MISDENFKAAKDFAEATEIYSKEFNRVAALLMLNSQSMRFAMTELRDAAKDGHDILKPVVAQAISNLQESQQAQRTSLHFLKEVRDVFVDINKGISKYETGKLKEMVELAERWNKATADGKFSALLKAVNKS